MMGWSQKSKTQKDKKQTLNLILFPPIYWISASLGLGVRIEDDILIAKEPHSSQLSCEVLSKDCPKNVKEIEELIQA